MRGSSRDAGARPSVIEGGASIELPGAREVDVRLVEAAVARINALHTAKGLELARAMGEYLVETFFGGSLENFAKERRHASWRALAEREDLLVSHSTLWSSVAILGQLRQLPANVGGALSVSHHRRLLAVRDPQAKETIATKAAADGLSVTELERELAKLRKKGKKDGRRGRPAIPDYLKSLRRLPKLVEPLTTHEISVEDVEQAGVEEMEEVLETLVEQLDTLTAARKELESALKKARAS